MSAIVVAVIYVPAARRLHPKLVRDALADIERRGYDLYGIVRDPQLMEDALVAGDAQVAIVVGGGGQDDGPTVRLSVRGRAAAGFNAEAIRRVLDGGPAPQGLDPETIAAARRIARALNDRGLT